jgi:hypothetical protein
MDVALEEVEKNWRARHIHDTAGGQPIVLHLNASSRGGDTGRDVSSLDGYVGDLRGWPGAVGGAWPDFHMEKPWLARGSHAPGIPD